MRHEMKLQVESEHYLTNFYDTKERFISYWHQINEIINLNPMRVLEIGIGNGFVSGYLKKRGVNIITLDIDRGLNPDIVGSTLDLPFLDNTFDAMACYEVLEHLPYKNFKCALAEMFRVSNSYVIISLPDANLGYPVYLPKIDIKKFKIRTIKILIPIPYLRKPIHHFDGEHYWEIGKSGYPLNKIINEINSIGFKIIKTYKVFDAPYHRFFVLEK